MNQNGNKLGNQCPFPVSIPDEINQNLVNHEMDVQKPFSEKNAFCDPEKHFRKQNANILHRTLTKCIL